MSGHIKDDRHMDATWYSSETPDTATDNCDSLQHCACIAAAIVNTALQQLYVKATITRFHTNATDISTHNHFLKHYYYYCFTALWIFSRTTRVSRYQKGKTKTNLDFLQQESVRGSGISWAICKSAPRPIHITMPTPHRPDALPAAQPIVSNHWRLVHLEHTARIMPHFCCNPYLYGQCV